MDAFKIEQRIRERIQHPRFSITRLRLGWKRRPATPIPGHALESPSSGDVVPGQAIASPLPTSDDFVPGPPSASSSIPLEPPNPQDLAPGHASTLPNTSSDACVTTSTSSSDDSLPQFSVEPGNLQDPASGYPLPSPNSISGNTSEFSESYLEQHTPNDLISEPALASLSLNDTASERAPKAPELNYAAYRLCIFCRRLESSDICPYLQEDNVGQGEDLSGWIDEKILLPPSDEKLLIGLQTGPSSLCNRCRAYDPISVFRFAQPPDTYEFNTDRSSLEAYIKDLRHHALELGELRHLKLAASCPFCRLIYRLILATSFYLPPNFKGASIVPFRAYHRFPDWEQLPVVSRGRSAILLGLSFDGTIGEIVTRRRYSPTKIGHFGTMTGSAITLTIRDPTSTTSSQSTHHRSQQVGRALTTRRSKYNGRLVEPWVDYELAKDNLWKCMKTHEECHFERPREIECISFIDVQTKTLVPYQKDCLYAALSYLWGMHSSQDLNNPGRTIEDAIIVSRSLGIRYLWVDRYCIEQDNPMMKKRQIEMMDLIYQSADVTLVALAGKDADAGLPGVSLPRELQLQETINGHNLFTVPPQGDFELRLSKWNTRAWTMQEGLLSRRKIYFSNRQVGFSCQLLYSSDAHNECFLHSEMGHPSDSFVASINSFNGSNEQSELHRTVVYVDVIVNYTTRYMAFDSDSLCACEGMLSALKRRMFPSGFECGLPLRDFPITLGWTHVPDDWKDGDALYHTRKAPQRRRDFPSWSWCGWEGNVQFSDLSLLHGLKKKDILSDLAVQFVSVEGIEHKTLIVKAWLVDLEVRTDIFSEAFAYESGQDAKRIPLGMVRERALPSVQNAVPSGKYSCLVIERQSERKGWNAQYTAQTVHMIVLDWEGEFATRRTSITLFADSEFMIARSEQKVVCLR